MNEEATTEITAEKAATETVVTDAAADKTADKSAASKDAGADKEAAKPAADKATGKSIATGGDTETEDKEKEAKEAADRGPTKAEVWQKMREEIAKHYAAGDSKIYKKELRRLEGISGPEGIWGMYRELESKFTSGGLVKMPGKDAKPEEISEFAKALGWPEKPEEMLDKIKLENGAVLGDADKPVLTGFLQAVNGATSAQEFASKATNWYFKQQEDQAAALDEADDTFRRESETALKDEFGLGAFKRKTNAIASLFATAPGGANAKNEKALFSRLMGGRTADGRIIGDDPDMVRFLVSMVSEINPSATVVEDGNQSGMNIDTEIASIEKRMKEDRRAYFKDEKAQARYRELITARDKIQARNRA